MSVQDLLYTAVGALSGVVTTLAAGIVFLYKKYEKRTAQLVDLAKEFSKVQDEHYKNIQELLQTVAKFPGYSKTRGKGNRKDSQPL